MRPSHKESYTSNISILEAARIAGCAPSVIHGCIQGSYPIDNLKKLCNHFGYSLAVALSGEPDKIANTFNINEYYAQATIFEGLAQIQIKKLEPLRMELPMKDKIYEYKVKLQHLIDGQSI